MNRNKILQYKKALAKMYVAAPKGENPDLMLQAYRYAIECIERVNEE